MKSIVIARVFPWFVWIHLALASVPRACAQDETALSPGVDPEASSSESTPLLEMPPLGFVAPDLDIALGATDHESIDTPVTASLMPPPPPASPAPGPRNRADMGSYRTPPVGPAPAESADLIRELVARYGLIDIRGSLATVAELRRMEQAFDSLPRSCFNRLRISIERDSNNQGDTGYWCPIDAAGNLITADRDPQDRTSPFAGGHIYYFGPRVTRWIFIHEIAHHVTIYLDPGYGWLMLDTLGYRIGPGQTTRSDDPARRLQFITSADRRRVPASAYPTRYATTDPQEHLAELVSIRHARNDPEYGPIAGFLRGFRMPPDIQTMIDGRFGMPPAP